VKIIKELHLCIH